MAYRHGNRDQITFLPDSIEKYVDQSDPVRAYDMLVNALALKSLGLNLDENKVGNSSYDPITMLKVLVYSYSYGWRSSRKIERALYHNLSFIWLAGGLKPDHKTIANFRTNNIEALKNVLKQCVRICIKLGLVEGNILFTDGSKIRANAGRSSTKSKASLEKQLKQIDDRIDAILAESQKIDNEEKGNFVKMQKELSSQQKLKVKITTLVEDMSDNESVNTTDAECRIMKSRQGSHASYNSQIVVDDANGLIVSVDTVNDVVDRGLLNNQIVQAETNLEKQCDVVCADAGYSSVDALKPLVDSSRTVIVPNGNQAQQNLADSTPFDKDKFIYDKQRDTYTCPKNKQLHRSYQAKGTNKIVYRMDNFKDCLACEYFNICTISKAGRTITRLVNEETQELLKSTYEQASSQQIYRRRKMRVELPFGHIKRNLKVNSYLLRGCKAAKAELSIMATCFNLSRMITLLGGTELMKAKLAKIV